MLSVEAGLAWLQRPSIPVRWPPYASLPKRERTSTTSGFKLPRKAKAWSGLTNSWTGSRLSSLGFAENPYLGRRRDDLRPGYRSFPVSDYVVIYRVADEE